MTTTAFILIAAIARNGAIGKDNRLLMHLPGDLPRFKRMTWGHTIIMGRKTWQSIGKALPGRRNIVLTRNREISAIPGVEIAHGLKEASQLVAGAQKAFIIGGAQIYSLALPIATTLELTEIDAELEGDAYFPAWQHELFEISQTEPHTTPEGLVFRYVTYQRKMLDK